MTHPSDKERIEKAVDEIMDRQASIDQKKHSSWTDVDVELTCKSSIEWRDKNPHPSVLKMREALIDLANGGLGNMTLSSVHIANAFAALSEFDKAQNTDSFDQDGGDHHG